MCGVSGKDRCRNSDVIERCGLKEDVVTRVKTGMLRWFGHLERTNECWTKNRNTRHEFVCASDRKESVLIGFSGRAVRARAAYFIGRPADARVLLDWNNFREIIMCWIPKHF
ncbi:hypothetical protein EVAR_28852_1 [Eumeta japonica]|uniref:Uncharacterized protein n=1 Tax=Eumeta variegata TaxID=151549 RepID=A0A4C1YKP1_EUMVA|nr:hypothetical protein EVAR_28852_1 [Eumeta japonica]